MSSRRLGAGKLKPAPTPPVLKDRLASDEATEFGWDLRGATKEGRARRHIPKPDRTEYDMAGVTLLISYEPYIYIGNHW
jgi:hypothetical protein